MKIKSDFKWLYFVSRRFSKVDKKSRSASTSNLASLGICFGVMALIVVMGVMNGFQMSFIDSILEISSYHVRVSELPKENEEEFISWCNDEKSIKSVSPYYEAQGLLVGNKGTQSAVIVRAVPENLIEEDPGFKKELNMIIGNFDLSQENFIVIGNTLAYNLGLRIGNSVNIAALSGSSDVALLSQNREFIVRGIFYSGYADINASYCFINLDSGSKNFGSSAKKTYGLKIDNPNNDSRCIAKIQNKFSQAQVAGWRSFNRSFFGALRLEKNMLFLLVFLIFIVVAINIYNGMKRLVFERKQEIAVLKALGSSSASVQNIFILQGALTGLYGAVPGLLCGMIICFNIDKVFVALSKIQFFFQYIFCLIFSPEMLNHISENSMFLVYAQIPARMNASENILIFMFGIFSALFASWFASRNILKLTVAEVLRNE